MNLLERHRDIAGFYVAGGGVEGALRAVREVTTSSNRPIVIGNELTPDRQTALQEGIATAVIGTPLPLLCTTLMEMMKGAVQNGMSETPGQVFLPFDLHVPESV